MSSETEHCLNRERQERAMAAASVDPRIAAIHTAMADSYFARASAETSSAAMRGRVSLLFAGGEVAGLRG